MKKVWFVIALVLALSWMGTNNSYAVPLCDGENPPPGCEPKPPLPLIPISNVSFYTWTPEEGSIGFPFESCVVEGSIIPLDHVVNLVGHVPMTLKSVFLTAIESFPDGSTYPISTYTFPAPLDGTRIISAEQYATQFVDQEGNYTITLIVNAAGFQQTLLSRSFTVNYCR